MLASEPATPQTGIYHCATKPSKTKCRLGGLGRCLIREIKFGTNLKRIETRLSGTALSVAAMTVLLGRTLT